MHETVIREPIQALKHIAEAEKRPRRHGTPALLRRSPWLSHAASVQCRQATEGSRSSRQLSMAAACSCGWLDRLVTMRCSV